MPAGKKLVVATSVIATGVCAALFFRKDASQVTGWQEAFYDSPFREQVERRVAADTAWAKTTAGGQVDSAARRVPAFRVPPAETAAISQQPVENLPPTFQKNFNPVGALLAPIEGVPIEEPLDDEAGWNHVAADEFSGAEPLVHRISDGDTLSKIAQRYLGGGDRYLEIFELNRDVLSGPDLLPIGAVLKIPPRAGPAERSPSDPPRDMVPVERENAEANEPS